MIIPFKAGAAAVDITPKKPMFLFGYPHVPRTSTGVHDPLFSSALALDDGQEKVVFVGNDVIYVSKETARRARQRIHDAEGVPPSRIMLTATHTHSGPNTIEFLSNEADDAVPPMDPDYLQQLEDGIVAAAQGALRDLREAEAGLAVCDSSMVGTNRRDPAGPRDPEAPVLLVREKDGGAPIALMMVVSMHPTVLHEDSTLVSGDFPGMTRHYLQQEFFGQDVPIIYHSGPCGNQSPRHVTRANTFEEARRLGFELGASAARAVERIDCRTDLPLAAAVERLELDVRQFPPVEEAQARLDAAVQKLESLRASGAPRTEVRTAECDWFGAEETLTLARAAQTGKLQETARSIMPAEVQVIQIGEWKFVGWQGEIFVEFGLDLKQRHENAYVITMANGELQGYIVTKEAAEEGGYEASNALFASPESGYRLVEASSRIIDELHP